MLSPATVLTFTLLFVSPVSAQKNQTTRETVDDLLDAVYFAYFVLHPIPDLVIQKFKSDAVLFSQHNVNDSRPKMLLLFFDAELARQQKKLDVAKNTFEQALNADSSTVLPWLGFAETCIDRNEGDTAHIYLTSAKYITSVPDKFQHLSYAQIGEFYERIGGYTDAINLYKAAVTKSPNWARGQRELASAYIDTNQPNKALSCLRKAITLEPKEARNFYLLGSAQSSLNEVKAAIESFQKAIELDPGEALYHYRLGLAFEAAGEKISAFQSLTTAFNLAEKSKKYPQFLEDT